MVGEVADACNGKKVARLWRGLLRLLLLLRPKQGCIALLCTLPNLQVILSADLPPPAAALSVYLVIDQWVRSISSWVPQTYDMLW